MRNSTAANYEPGKAACALRSNHQPASNLLGSLALITLDPEEALMSCLNESSLDCLDTHDHLLRRLRLGLQAWSGNTDLVQALLLNSNETCIGCHTLPAAHVPQSLISICEPHLLQARCNCIAEGRIQQASKVRLRTVLRSKLPNQPNSTKRSRGSVHRASEREREREQERERER